MLNIAETKGTLYKIKEVGNMVLATFRTSKKVNEEWTSMFWNAKFVGKEKEKLLDCGDKTKISIISAICEQNKYNEKMYTNVVVFKFDVLDKVSKQSKTDDDTELPF